MTGTYDPDLDLVFWGIGNPAPWNPRARNGDNLFTNSILAMRPKTGERVWYYQATPSDPFDYDAVQTPINATINVDGKPTQGGDAGQPQRLPLCARCEDRQAARRQRLRQGELGERDRHGNRAADGDRRLQGRACRQERHRLAVGIGRDQLAAHVVQPEDRAALHQHVQRRHDLSRRREPPKLTPGAPSGVPHRQAHRGHRRSERARFSQSGRSHDRQVEMGDARTGARTTPRPW